MSPSARYAAYLVDFDGTLYRPHWVKLAMLAELSLFGLGALRVLRAFRQLHERVRLEDDPRLESPYALQIHRTAELLKLEVAAVEACVAEWMIQRPQRYIRWFRRTELLSELHAFRAGGGRTAIVSDYPAREKLGAIDGAPPFDVIVASGEPDGPRRLKPAPDGYLLAAERLGVAPERCLVIGDREDADGAAARAAGMDFRLVG